VSGVDAARRAAGLIGLALLVATAASAQTVQELIDKNLAARGGVDKLRSIETVKSAGKLTGRGLTMSTTTWAKRPNKLRRETKFPDRTITVAFDGTTVWGLDSTIGKPQPMTGPQAESARAEAGIDPLFLDYKEKGIEIELAGTETIEGQPAHHLKVTKPGGRVAHHYVSAETGLELRIVETFDQGGIKTEVRTDLSNYKAVEGMQVPFTIKQYASGNLAVEFNLEQVEFNVLIDDEMFSPK